MLNQIGTNGRLSTRLGPWYPNDQSNRWEWYIHENSMHLLQLSNGDFKKYTKLGRSRIAPRFSVVPEFIEECPLDNYVRTTVDRENEVFLSKGAAITGLPAQESHEHSPSFEWLHYKVVQTDSIVALLHDLLNHKIIAVTDGSYHPFDETGSAAWTIESATGQEYISGISLIPGSPSSQSAIRSELVGVLAILAFMN